MEGVEIEVTSDQVRRESADGDWIGTGPNCRPHGLVPRDVAEAMVARGEARYRTLAEVGDESRVHPDAGDDDQCQATTGDGDRCKNDALDGSAYCGVHQPDEE